jgi:hypothetical protein
MTEEHGAVEIGLCDVVKASLIGRDYMIDKKTKRPKRKKQDERSARGGGGGTAKGDES